MQALLTNVLQGHWEWQEDRRTDFLASLHVKTAFDVAKPSVVSKTHTLTGVHRHVAAALLAEMRDVKGSAFSRIARGSFATRGASARAGWRPSIVEATGQICIVERRGKVEGMRVGTCFRREVRQRVRAQGCDVGGPLLAIQ